MAAGSGWFLGSLLTSCGSTVSVFKTAAVNNRVNIPLSDFGESNFRLIRVNNYNYDIAVQKTGTGSYRALVMMCTHAGNPLTKTGSNFYCPLHGSQFDMAGRVQKGPAEKPLIHLNTQQDDKNLWITLKPAVL